MNIPKSLSFEEQINLFKERGMVISPNDAKVLERIGYYRFKEFARPLSSTTKENETVTISYSDVSFGEVLTRYYQDKNLRNHLLHAIEKVEVSVKTKLSYILGKEYGPFGYLDFQNWCNRNANSKFVLEQKQVKFKNRLKKSIDFSYTSDIKNKANQENDGFPTVWLAIDVLMFGELVNMIEIMSIRNQKQLAHNYNCSVKELISWLRCLNFVRNMCAHNSNVIDLKLETTPKYKDEWNDLLYQIQDKTNQTRPTNRLAVVFLILKHLVSYINANYNWRKISYTVSRICDNNEKKHNS